MKYTQGREPHVQHTTFCIRKSLEEEYLNLHNEHWNWKDIQANSITGYLWLLDLLFFLYCFDLF